MPLTIALAGNPNSGKTTLFNHLTGANQYVGNWPGVTIEKKEGRIKDHSGVILQDLPGIYSLSPYTPEEVIARDYLTHERPDVIINVVDASNLERNLYLSTQLLELGIPLVMALNMMDLVKKAGDSIDRDSLSKAMSCPVVEITALRGQGVKELVNAAIQAAGREKTVQPLDILKGEVRETVSAIETLIREQTEPQLRLYSAIKLFERDEKFLAGFDPGEGARRKIEGLISACEEKMEDDSESLITAQRYAFISALSKSCQKRAQTGRKMNISDRIDRVVTNRVLALPIFAAVMFLIYYVSVTTVGSLVTDFTNETLFGKWIAGSLRTAMEGWEVAPWLIGLTVDGVIAGVGAVLGFVPQMLVLFIFLGILEDVGYLARVAFIMDRIFRRFGLSGKSFIPMLIGSGCSVPGIMASRTIEQVRDRRITIITTSFIPCSAKMPIIALFAGAIYGSSGWVATIAYLAGVLAVILSGIILKKTRAFAGDPAPFVMELPPYHLPLPGNILRAAWERGWSFIKRAGSVILLSSVVLWFLQAFGVREGVLTMVEDNNTSLLAAIGSLVAPIFAPLGFGEWKAAVATFTGLIAKENVVNTYGVLYGFAEVSEDGVEIWSRLRMDFTNLSAASFILFNLLCVPCFAAIGAIKREMNHAGWTIFALLYQSVLAYAVSLIVFQFGLLFTGYGVSFLSVLSVLVFLVMLYLLLRPRPRYAQLESAGAAH